MKRNDTILDGAWITRTASITARRARIPLYAYINLNKEGRLVDVYKDGGKQALEKVIRSEVKPFLYNDGRGRVVKNPGGNKQSYEINEETQVGKFT